MKRNQAYLKTKKQATNPIKKKEDVQRSNDQHIDQDYPGFPHHPSPESIINPQTKEDNIVADVDKREKEKAAGSSNNT